MRLRCSFGCWSPLPPGNDGKQPDEVMVVLVQEIEMLIEVKRGRGIGQPDVLEVVPGVRSGQVDDLAFAVGKVARIRLEYAQRAGGGPGLRIVTSGIEGDEVDERQEHPETRDSRCHDRPPPFMSLHWRVPSTISRT